MPEVKNQNPVKAKRTREEAFTYMEYQKDFGTAKKGLKVKVNKTTLEQILQDPKKKDIVKEIKAPKELLDAEEAKKAAYQARKKQK